jgi:hypothetical protein
MGDLDAAHEQALSYFTHIARAELIDRGVYPASRPELPKQLRSIGDSRLAHSLEQLLHTNFTEPSEILRIVDNAVIRM